MPDARHRPPRFVHSWAHRLALGTAVGLFSFGGGLCAGLLIRQDRSIERFGELVRIGLDLGIITVDQQRLDEIICVMSEAEWEDRDAAERGEETE